MYLPRPCILPLVRTTLVLELRIQLIHELGGCPGRCTCLDDPTRSPHHHADLFSPVHFTVTLPPWPNPPPTPPHLHSPHPDTMKITGVLALLSVASTQGKATPTHPPPCSDLEQPTRIHSVTHTTTTQPSTPPSHHHTTICFLYPLRFHRPPHPHTNPPTHPPTQQPSWPPPSSRAPSPASPPPPPLPSRLPPSAPPRTDRVW